jgi:hypothetical protein
MYDDDLRWLVVWQHMFLHRSIARIAEDTTLSRRTVFRILRCYRLHGDVWPPRHYTPLQRGPPPLLDAAAQTRLRQWIDHDSAFALWELKAMVVRYDCAPSQIRKTDLFRASCCGGAIRCGAR